jgi:uncharacterized protein YndB with AHSA1/START domain
MSKSAIGDAAREIVSVRLFHAPREAVYRAFSDPAILARWWGPQGFTNTIETFDLRPGGAWNLTMHSPEGVDYLNQSEFVEVAPAERIVYEHLEPGHHFRMTITLAEQGSNTVMAWVMRFDAAEECRRIESFVAAANQQNFDRLAEQLAVQGLAEPKSDPAREILVAREFDAPRELVFDAWTQPEHAGQWWGPTGFTTTTLRMDVRPGGVWEHVMHGPDGVDYPNRTIYEEVVRPERLVYSHGGNKPGDVDVQFRVTVTFEDVGGKTRLTMRSVFPSVEDRERVVRDYGALEGAHQHLGRLAQYLPQMQ